MTSTKDGKFTVRTEGKTVTLITPSGEELTVWYQLEEIKESDGEIVWERDLND